MATVSVAAPEGEDALASLAALGGIGDGRAARGVFPVREGGAAVWPPQQQGRRMAERDGR
jgi:hypothetical protein